jgi:anti-sigma factor RsiW
MYNEEDLTPSERELESALGQLKPVTNTLNRDVLMFNAGRVTAGKKRPWQMLSVVLALLLFCSVLNRPDQNGARSLSSGPGPGEFQMMQTSYRAVQAEPSGSLAYPILRQNIVRYGLNALRFQQGVSHSEPLEDRKQLLDSMLSL